MLIPKFNLNENVKIKNINEIFTVFGCTKNSVQKQIFYKLAYLEQKNPKNPILYKNGALIPESELSKITNVNAHVNQSVETNDNDAALIMLNTEQTFNDNNETQQEIDVKNILESAENETKIKTQKLKRNK